MNDYEIVKLFSTFSKWLINYVIAFYYITVLGSEYCSGYMDALGKWNNGFYCPASDESQDVFCCGTESHKYCCTKKDQVIQSEVQE